MSATTKRIADLHDLLSDEYRKQPYVTTKNIRTEALWAEIERLQAQDNDD